MDEHVCTNQNDLNTDPLCAKRMAPPAPVKPRFTAWCDPLSEDINVSFDGFKALNNLNPTSTKANCAALSARTGQVKSTMMDVITGKTRP